MKRHNPVLILALAVGLCSVSCSDDDDNPAGPSTTTGDTVYGDISASGTEDGSAGSPYNTVGEAITAASAGDMVYIAAGVYGADETFPLNLKPGVTLRGAAADSTRIMGPLQDLNVADARPIVLEQLRFESFRFGRDTVPSAPTGTNRIIFCIVDGETVISHGGGYHFSLEYCTLVGKVDFGHAGGNSHDAVRYCTIADTLEFASGGATDSAGMSQVVLGCNIAGHLRFGSGGGSVDTIASNTIASASIRYVSG